MSRTKLSTLEQPHSIKIVYRVISVHINTYEVIGKMFSVFLYTVLLKAYSSLLFIIILPCHLLTEIESFPTYFVIVQQHNIVSV